MSQQPSQKFPSLHPILQGALRSLDADLETVLTEYRTARSLRGFSPLMSQHQGSPLSQVMTSGELAIAQNLTETAELSVQNASADLLTPSVEDASLLELTRHRLYPDDYLESSESLLNQLQEAKAPQKFNSMGILLTAWGISFTVLLLGGVAVSYLVLETRWFGLSWLNSGSRASRIAVQPPPAAYSSPPQPTEPSIAPDLSAKEFIKLDLSNLSQLKSSSSKVGQSNPQLAPIITPPTSHPLQLATSPSTPTTPKLVKPSPPATQKQPRSLSVTPKVASTTPGDGYYYVVVNYTGVKVLQQTQKVVKDAYPRDFLGGKQIQVGAFNDKPSAQNLVQALKRQGVTATIRQP